MKEQDAPLPIRIFNDPQPIPRRVPDYMRTRGGILYWTGALIMFTFIYEILTGLVILIYYEPSNAYKSTEAFLNTAPFGSLILTTHLYAAYAMIFLIYVHLLRNLLVGAYKKPREIQWLTGIALLAMTIGVSFFGYSMSGDILSADAVGIGQTIAGGFPYLGDYLRTIFFGTGTSVTLFQSMLAWHIILAAGIGFIFALHFFLAEYNTIMPSRKEAGYEAPALDRDDGSYKPWYPYNLFYMVQYMMLTFGFIFIIPSVLAIAPNVPVLFSPFPQVAAGTPVPPSFPAYPPWFLLFVYKELDFIMVDGLTPFWSTMIFVGAPLAYLILLPYLDSRKTLKLSDRPVTVAFSILGVFYLIGLSVWAVVSPGAQEPDIYVMPFFLIPAAVILPLSFYLSRRIGDVGLGLMNKLHVETSMAAWAVAALLLGLSSFLTGHMISVLGSSFTAEGLAIAVILTAMTLAEAVVIVEILTRNLHGRESPLEFLRVPKPAVLGLGTIGVLVAISAVNPSNVYDEAIYGIGLGMIFFLAGMLIREYRKSELGE